MWLRDQRMRSVDSLPRLAALKMTVFWKMGSTFDMVVDMMGHLGFVLLQGLVVTSCDILWVVEATYFT